MDNWTQIRSEARRLHRRARAAGGASEGPLAAAAELLSRAEEMSGVTRIGVPAGDPLLFGSLATLSQGYVWYNDEVESWFALYCQAHEYAHHWLHHGQTHCTREDIEGASSEDVSPVGEVRITGYGPHERREREANAFALEYLLPAESLRRCFVDEGMNAEAISALSGLPVRVVCRQLARALLVSEEAGVTQATHAEPSVSTGSELQANAPAAIQAYELDKSQREAAHATSGPLLIEAGPGTGKTRTLVGRVLHLLGRGVAPENILALTFSNKAAEEMRERVEIFAPEAAPRIWMGTFHAFGLELLRRYWEEAGLPPKPELLDPVDALFLLERALPDLRLDRYQNLYEPTRYLKDILGAISRAKDELADPARYRELAEAMLAGASDDDGRESAEKAREVARVYAYYQEYIERLRLLDFGDLIFRTVRLLRENARVRGEVRSRYREVLVDEYQDVNRASGLLLREVCGEGRGLWAVGDIRQSVYRWRGASTANMRLFREDFSGARVLPLKINYRSQPPVVSTFAEFAPRMSATAGLDSFASWQPHRPHEGGAVKYEVAEDFEAEAALLAGEMKSLRERGVPFGRQALICRSHGALGRFAAELEKAGVPVLYLGDIFERHEGRDMLSLLSLTCEGRGRSLLRIARFPEYQIPFGDVRKLLALSDLRGVKFPEALGLAAEAGDISEEGRRKFALLKGHIEGICEGSSAWETLSQYLFVRSNYLRPLLADDSVAGRQRKLALYQLLQFTKGEPGSEWYRDLDPKLALLKYVRRLEMFGEERNYRQVPAWAEKFDAVRLLTIHASKGLEFDAVFLPQLGGRYVPHSGQYQPCPPPAGLTNANTADEHLEEEECLFFVAMSRARDLLCLTRAQTYGRQKSNPSKFLELIRASLPSPADAPPSRRREPAGADAAAAPASTGTGAPQERVAPPRFSERHLELYMRCPKQYFYERVVSLTGKREDSAYAQFHSCVYATVGWLRREAAAGRKVPEEAAREKLREVWEEKGPRAHAYEGVYLERAEEMVRRAVSDHTAPDGEVSQPDWEVTLSNGRVTIRPDWVEVITDGPRTSVVVRRVRTGRPSDSEPKDKVYALYHAAAKRHHPSADLTVKIVYLSTGDVQESVMNDKQVAGHLKKYEEAIAGIRRGDFPPRPDPFACPSCAHYFVCPSGDL